MLAVGAAAAAAATLSGCSQLSLFNALVPTDGASRRAGTDIVFGPSERQRLDIYVPAEAGAASPAGDKKGAPVALFIYGGSWQNGSKDEYAFVGHALAAAGFVTLIADYRLVPTVRYPDFVADGALALGWAKANIGRFGGDPARMHVIGHSAGAYNAVMIAAAPRFLARHGVSRSDLVAVAGLSGPYDFLPLDTPATRAAFGAVDDLAATQPVNLVSSTMPPVFLASGGRDSTVRPRNSRALAAQLQASGVPHLLRIYPELGHAGTLLALSRPLRGRAPVMDDMLTFFETVG